MGKLRHIGGGVQVSLPKAFNVQYTRTLRKYCVHRFATIFLPVGVIYHITVDDDFFLFPS